MKNKIERVTIAVVSTVLLLIISIDGVLQDESPSSIPAPESNGNSSVIRDFKSVADITLESDKQTFTYSVSSRFFVFLDDHEYPVHLLKCEPQGIVGRVTGGSFRGLDFYPVYLEAIKEGRCILQNRDFRAYIVVEKSMLPPMPTPTPRSINLENIAAVCFFPITAHQLRVSVSAGDSACLSSSCTEVLERTGSIKVDEDNLEIQLYSRFVAQEHHLGPSVVAKECTDDCAGAGFIDHQIELENGKYTVKLGDEILGRITIPFEEIYLCFDSAD